jgi:hypothetical protein
MRSLYHITIYLLVMCVVLTGTAIFALYATSVGTPTVTAQDVPIDWERKVDAAVDLETLKQECRVFAKLKDMEGLVRRAQNKWMSDTFTYGVAFALGWGLLFGLHLAYMAFRLQKLQLPVRDAPL